MAYFRRFIIGLLLVCPLQAQAVPTWRAFSGFLEMTVGSRLCRWWALHATAQIEVACQTNEMYDTIAIGRELQGFYRLSTDVPVIPVGVATVNVGGAPTALLFPLVSGAITWLVTASGGMFSYQIVGWPAGGLPLIETGSF